MVKTYSMILAGRELKVEIGKVAGLANGSAMVSYGDTTILATVVASNEPKEGIDFFQIGRASCRERVYALV